MVVFPLADRGLLRLKVLDQQRTKQNNEMNFEIETRPLRKNRMYCTFILGKKQQFSVVFEQWVIYFQKKSPESSLLPYYSAVLSSRIFHSCYTQCTVDGCDVTLVKN